jgi:hypothetical protein
MRLWGRMRRIIAVLGEDSAGRQRSLVRPRESAERPADSSREGTTFLERTHDGKER